MKIKISHNINDFEKRLVAAGERVRENTVLKMYGTMNLLKASILSNLRKGGSDHLHVRSGELLNSIQQEITQHKNKIVGRIGPRGVKYARIHEEGGTIPARIAKKGKVLAFKGKDGEMVFRKRVGPSEIKARPYLKPALESNRKMIVERFTNIFTAIT